MTLLSCLLPLAFADPPAGQLMVSVRDSPSGCTLSLDGVEKGALPLRLSSVPAGEHAFAVRCPDGRAGTWTRSVDTASGKLAMVELGPLPAAPPPAPGGPPVPTYVLLSRIQGERVQVDGGEPVALPWRGVLAPGSHEFVVLNPDGTVRARLTRDVVPVNGNAVVKLD